MKELRLNAKNIIPLTVYLRKISINRKETQRNKIQSFKMNICFFPQICWNSKETS